MKATTIGETIATPRSQAQERPRRSIYADRLREFAEFAFGDDEPFARRGAWREFFRQRIGPGFDGRIVFEVGCADAAFLSHIAAQHPGAAFIGLDWKARAVYNAARRVADLRLRNIALLRGRAQDVRNLFAPSELDEVWVFHPDPCDREVELNHRLIAPPFLSDVHHVLRDGSSVLALKTDHPGYYQWTLGLLGLPQPDWTSARTRLRDVVHPARIPAPSAAIRRQFDVAVNSANYWQDAAALDKTSARPFAGEATPYEAKFLKKRLPIYYLELRRRPLQ